MFLVSMLLMSRYEDFDLYNLLCCASSVYMEIGLDWL